MKRFALLAAAACATLVAAGIASAATAPVTAANMNGWYFWDDNGAGSLGGPGSLVAGPGTPPIGLGSAKLPAIASGDRPVIATDAYAGTLLSSITALEYSTYRVTPIPNSNVFAIALQFDIDYDATDGITSDQGRLVWEAYISGPTNASPVRTGMWQGWNPFTSAGGWWFSSAPGNTNCRFFPNAAATCSWAEVKAFYPNAAIRLRTLFKAGGGWTNFNGSVDSFTIGISGANTTWNFDTRGPAITASATSDGNPYTSGTWTNDDVVVHYACTVDGGGSVASLTADQTVSTDGSGQSRSGTCTDGDGNTVTASFSDIRIDKTPPTIAGSATPAANANGWNNTDVTITFTCDASISGLDTLTAPVTLSSDGTDQPAAGTCVDMAGNSASTTLEGIDIDQTKPAIAYSGNAGTYLPTDTVDITCSASDALSGLDVGSTNCEDVTGAAWTFGPGTHTFNASAADNAGNTNLTSTTFTVAATYDSLCALTEQFSSKKNENDLCNHLEQAQKAEQQGKLKDKQKKIEQYIEKVQKDDEAFTASQVATLVAFAQTL